MIKSQHNAFFICLILLITLRSIIPVGYMPAQDAIAKGQLTLDICNSHAQTSLVINIPGTTPDTLEQEADELLPCLFGYHSLAQAIQLPANGSFLLFTPTALPYWTPGQSLILFVTTLFFPLGSRAPPVLPD